MKWRTGTENFPERPFFITFDYIVAVIQTLQFVDYKDVLRFYFFNAI
jgi:hypothetical protein